MNNFESSCGLGTQPTLSTAQLEHLAQLLANGSRMATSPQIPRDQYYLLSGDYPRETVPLISSQTSSESHVVRPNITTGADVSPTMNLTGISPSAVAASQPQINLMGSHVILPVPDGTGFTRYPEPDVKSLIFDPATGYRFDSFTGLYYDANSNFFINKQQNVLLQFDKLTSTYKNVGSASNLSQPKMTKEIAFVAGHQVAMITTTLSKPPTPPPPKISEKTSTKEELPHSLDMSSDGPLGKTSRNDIRSPSLDKKRGIIRSRSGTLENDEKRVRSPCSRIDRSRSPRTYSNKTSRSPKRDPTKISVISRKDDTKGPRSPRRDSVRRLRSPRRDPKSTSPRRDLRRKSRSPRRDPIGISRSPRRDLTKKSRSPRRDPIKNSRSPRRDLRRKSRSPRRDPIGISRSPRRDLTKKSRSPRRDPIQNSRSPRRDLRRKSRSPRRDPIGISRSPRRDLTKKSRSPRRDPIRISPRRDLRRKSRSPRRDPIGISRSPRRDLTKKSRSPRRDPIKNSRSPRRDLPRKSRSPRRDSIGISQSPWRDLTKKSRTPRRDPIKNSRSPRRDVPRKSRSQRKGPIRRSRSPKQALTRKSRSPRRDVIRRPHRDPTRKSSPRKDSARRIPKRDTMTSRSPRRGERSREKVLSPKRGRPRTSRSPRKDPLTRPRRPPTDITNRAGSPNKNATKRLISPIKDISKRCRSPRKDLTRTVSSNRNVSLGRNRRDEDRRSSPRREMSSAGKLSRNSLCSPGKALVRNHSPVTDLRSKLHPREDRHCSPSRHSKGRAESESDINHSPERNLKSSQSPRNVSVIRHSHRDVWKRDNREGESGRRSRTSSNYSQSPSPTRRSQNCSSSESEFRMSPSPEVELIDLRNSTSLERDVSLSSLSDQLKPPGASDFSLSPVSENEALITREISSSPLFEELEEPGILEEISLSPLSVNLEDPGTHEEINQRSLLSERLDQLETLEEISILCQKQEAPVAPDISKSPLNDKFVENSVSPQPLQTEDDAESLESGMCPQSGKMEEPTDDLHLDPGILKVTPLLHNPNADNYTKSNAEKGENVCLKCSAIFSTALGLLTHLRNSDVCKEDPANQGAATADVEGATTNQERVAAGGGGGAAAAAITAAAAAEPTAAAVAANQGVQRLVEEEQQPI